MKRIWRYTATVVASLLLGGAAMAEVDPMLPVEYVPFVGSKGVVPTVSVKVTYQASTHLFSYSYGVRNGPSAKQPLIDFDIVTGAEIVSSGAPGNWGPAAVFKHSELPFYEGPEGVTWIPEFVEEAMQPGHGLNGFALGSPAAPGVGTLSFRGDVVPPSGQQVQLPPPPDYSAWPWDDCVKVTGLVPDVVPSPDPVVQVDRLKLLLQQAVTAGWITSPQLVDKVARELRRARVQLKANRLREAAEILRDLRSDLKSGGDDGCDRDDRHEKKPAMNESAAVLLDANLAVLISTLPGGHHHEHSALPNILPFALSLAWRWILPWPVGAG